MSMLHPSYKEMISKMNDAATEEDMEINSRYSLVIAAAKRARQINSGSEPLVSAKEKEKKRIFLSLWMSFIPARSISWTKKPF